MRLIVDSHVLLWHLLDDARLDAASSSLIEADDAEALVSVASLWEIAIMVGLGKLHAPDDLPDQVVERGFQLLNVTDEHVWHVKGLPHHHSDPFDRLLIAQAQIERLPILTAHTAFVDYDVEVLWG